MNKIAWLTKEERKDPIIFQQKWCNLYIGKERTIVGKPSYNSEDEAMIAGKERLIELSLLSKEVDCLFINGRGDSEMNFSDLIAFFPVPDLEK